MRRIELLLIGIGTLAAVFLSAHSAKNTLAMAKSEFQSLTQISVQTLEDRMRTYLQSLNGAGAFLNSSDHVTVVDFDRYVETLDIERFLPGISGIGFIEPISPSEQQSFLNKMWVIGHGNFAIHPQTDRPERFVINRISPLEPNKEALGLDITFEEGRRSAAETARDTRTPQLTPRIMLVQDQSKKPGFLLLRPLYWEEGAVHGPHWPEHGFRGWVYAPFTGKELMKDLMANEGRAFYFQVFDGKTTDPGKLIYASEGDPSYESDHTFTYEIPLYGRAWTIVFRSTAQFDGIFHNLISVAILVLGVLLTAMILFSVRNLGQRNQALSQLADIRSREVSAREQENRSVVENAVTVVLILDNDDNILFANQAAQNCFEYTADEIHALKFDALVRAMQEAAEDHNATGMTKSGRQLVLDLQRNEWMTADGATRTTAIIRDLTKELAAQYEVKKTKISYDYALNGSRIGVFDVDLRNNTSDVSSTWRDLMGIENDPDIDTQGEFLNRIHPDDLAIIFEADARCIRGETERSTSEFRVSFPDDVWRWMRSDAVVVERDTDGNATRLIGTQTDVTDLRHARNALEANEKQFRQVISAAPIGMALMQEDGRFTVVNEALCALLGWDEQSIIENFTMADILPGDVAETLFKDLGEMVEMGLGVTYTAEHQLLHKDGEERWGLMNISWTFDKNLGGNVFIAQINDITDKKKIDKVKNEFVATVSHELRTPLTSIKGALALISASPQEGVSPSNKRLIEIAVLNTDRLTSIVNDILDLEKIASGKVDFNFYPEDMRDLITQSVDELAPFAMTHDNTLVVDVPQTPLWVLADYSRTKQVLFNLVSNACKYSTKGTQVLIKAEELDGVAIVYVQNEGQGIPESFRPKMFGAFSQVDASDTRASGGTGLGLNISKQIVSRHSGEIGYESRQGGVTVFWFTYPLTDPETFEETDKPGQKVPEKAGANLKGLRVLHLEQDADFAEIVSSGLKDVAQFSHVSTIPEAMSALHHKDLDVVILDCELSAEGTSGFLDEVYRTKGDLRVIGLSAGADIRPDNRLYANLVKSRADLDTIAKYVAGDIACAS